MSQEPDKGTDRPSDDDQSEAEVAISRLFEDYLTGFNDFDAERICDCFALPVTIWQHEKGHVFNDEDELLENVEALLAALDKEGVTVSEFQVVSSHVSGSAALVTLDWSQEASNGETALEFTCHYQLIQDGDDWTIALVINE
jgi:ketosteroid isomerase-like protein